MCSAVRGVPHKPLPSLPNLPAHLPFPTHTLCTGIGGFSAGAIEAGNEVVLGIDDCSEALSCFAANNPGAKAKCLTLPAEVNWPTGDDVHAHFSPPCTALSRARAGSATAEQLDGGMEHLRWSVKMGLTHFTSFSVETVSVPSTKALMDEQVEANPGRFSYHEVECSDYGVPQTRRRLIAGSPEMILRLKEMPVSNRVSVSDAFGGKPPAPCIKNTTSRGPDGVARCLRPCTQPAFTVCGARSLSWADRDGNTVRCMPAAELAVLQTLPRGWILPKRTRAATLAVGNAVPSKLAASIMRAAAGQLQPMPLVKKRARDEDVDLRNLQQRVLALEEIVATVAKAWTHTPFPARNSE